MPAPVEDGPTTFAMGGNVVQETPADGDLYMVGGDIKLLAGVAGKLYATGGNVQLDGPVAGSAYAAGGNVEITSPVGGDVRVAGGDVRLASSARIGGDLSIAGGSIEIEGPIAGGVHAAGGHVRIDNVVRGDASVRAGSVVLGPNAVIEGTLRHAGPGKVERAPGAQVKGGVASISNAEWLGVDEDDEGVTEVVRPAKQGDSDGLIFILMLAAIVAGFAPSAGRSIGTVLARRPGGCVLWGFIALVCIPVLVILLAVTIIGIPIALFGLLAYPLLLLAGYVSFGVAVGLLVLRRWKPESAEQRGWQVGAALGATLLIGLLGMLPGVGTLIDLLILIVGVGALVILAQQGWRARRAPVAA